MKYLLIVDLMGTLLEARQLTNGIFDPNDYRFKVYNMETPRHENVEQEYISRIDYVARKLNKILENGIKVAIVTSIDHCTEYQLISTINFIDSKISANNKNRIEYYIDGLGKNVVEPLNNRTFIVLEREEAYDFAISKGKGYYYITIDDDLVNASCISKVLNLGGQFVHIDNRLNSIGWITYEDYEYFRKKFHMDDSFDRLVKYYEFVSSYYDLSPIEDSECYQNFNFSKEETYLRLLSNKLGIEEFYSWVILRDIQRAFKESSGYSFGYTQELINHHCIQIYPSFEQAYQKVLKPKIQENRFQSCCTSLSWESE